MKTQEVKVHSKQHLEKQKLRKKKIKRVLFWVKSVLLTAVIVTTLVMFALSPVFNIRSIEVSGGKHYSKDEIAKTTGIVLGTNGFRNIGSNIRSILTFRYGNAEHNILKSKPYIKDVTVRFIIPNRVKVSLIEREPAAITSYMEKKLIVDREGYVLESLSNNDKKGLPLILGLNITRFEIGQPLDFKGKTTMVNINSAFKMLDAVKSTDKASKNKLYQYLDYIDAADTDNIYIGIDSRFKINFGSLQNLDYNLNFLREIFYTNLKNSNDKGILDITLKEPVLMNEE